MRIAEHVWDEVLLGAKISSFSDLEDFFETCQMRDVKAWPLNMPETGYKTKYSRAELVCDKFGFGQTLALDVLYQQPASSYFVSENIYADIDKVEINLVSIYRKNEENFKPDGFIRRFVEKHYRFLKDYVKENEILPENATLIIEAHSKENKNAEARGGYVWATYGFEFLDVHELNQVRLRFKNFAAQRGVDIALKDLAYFKYPCHFAAFRCAQNGQIHDLGKEFLLQDTWLGKISASISTKSEPYRYAKAYHEKNKKAAEKELSRPFLRMMNRYTKQNKMKDIFLSLRGLKKQRC